MSDAESGGAAALPVREARVTAEQGEANVQHEKAHREGEGALHAGEAVGKDDRNSENSVVAAGITVDVHGPPDSATARSFPSDRKSLEEAHPSQGQPRQPTSRGDTVVAASETSFPVSTATRVASPAARDTGGSPYRAVYHGETNWGGTAARGEEDAHRGSNSERSTFRDTFSSLRGLASRARQSVSRVAQGDFTDFRRAGESIHRVGTGDFSELAGIEQYLFNLFEECTALSEKLCPCVLPEVRQNLGESHGGPPPIMMSVDTPGGPYVRLIPDALVEESVRQGLLSAAEVERQRQEASYTPVAP